MSVVPEDHLCFLQLTTPLHEDVPGPVDEDVRYSGVPYERLDGSEPEGLVLDFDDDLIPLPAAERCLLFREQILDESPDLLLDDIPWEDIDLREVDPLDQMAMDAGLQLVGGPVARALHLVGGDAGNGFYRFLGLAAKYSHLFASLRKSNRAPQQAQQRSRSLRRWLRRLLVGKRVAQPLQALSDL